MHDPMQLAFDLIVEGKNKRSAATAGPTSTNTTPEAVNLPFFGHHARPFQLIDEDYENGGIGVLLALEMEMNKKLVALAFLATRERIAYKPHLVLLPLSLVTLWATDRAPGGQILLTWLISKAEYTMEELEEFDVVIATYEKLRYENMTLQRNRQRFFANFEDPQFHDKPSRCDSVLPVIEWHVVVLDEAHRIANSSSDTFEAANRLQAVHKLPMTGTPFQNEYTDIQSIMRFLRVFP
ncbi:hypothetical protein P153DRAFT_382363 [Dothidotthia symphoricarpi CBS 119687]|uniref:Helicase ATP-binding domain-containing protein n=1 Tax=Dothidotthia symphoricarpi CBS 119687 TaxID=1392245 RepID=A0A6A6AQE8_9PLEO|nr:uncharacterized protein P153DRAFT_382363 [Dothidotthia symphoricarpi CBS 119687]KAF2132741.1 hypothetical protein P153DRAFT_382363 [Dothidotthia symphoricarpi CBS 119687]